jgi:hypothetical protein
LGQPVAFQQPAILRRVVFVNTKREGKQIFYSVNYTRLDYVAKQAIALNPATSFMQALRMWAIACESSINYMFTLMFL